MAIFAHFVLKICTNRFRDYIYTIKKFHAENSFDPYGHINNNKIELRSLNPKYHTITLGASTDNDLKTIGIFIKTL